MPLGWMQSCVRDCSQVGAEVSLMGRLDSRRIWFGIHTVGRTLGPGDREVPYNGDSSCPREPASEIQLKTSQLCLITHMTACDLCCILLVKRVRLSSDSPMQEAELGESQIRLTAKKNNPGPPSISINQSIKQIIKQGQSKSHLQGEAIALAAT